MTVIPLFPLNVVLFPASKLPLYIFEERYKKMINDCMDEQSSFGINFFSDNHLYPTGCFAKVDQLVSRTEKGEMNIITKGIGRYEILKDLLKKLISVKSNGIMKTGLSHL